MNTPEQLPWSREEFERQLRAKGERYHIHHPFQMLMNSGGGCTRAQQERALEILQFKLDVLWSMVDAMQTAYGLTGERRVA